jgi:hypothetical protein
MTPTPPRKRRDDGERDPSVVALAPAGKPEFADNQDLAMKDALNNHLDWLLRTQVSAPDLSIASGYFDPLGFALIAHHLERLPKVRLLLGAEPLTPPSRPRPKPGKTDMDFEREAVEQALRAHAEGIASDRDLLGFKPDVDRHIQRLLDYLKSGKVEVRRYTKSFLHGKAFIFRHATGEPEGYMVGSSNFTGAGLSRNVELNVGRYDGTPVQQVQTWFDRLWDDSDEFDLAAFYKARYEEYAPWLIYLRVLLERFGNDLDGDQGTLGQINLTGFQRDGVSRARRILEQYHGVIFADGVGLGKTFVGGDLIRAARVDKRQRALLIAPAALRDGTWARFQALHDFRFEAVSYEQLVLWHKGQYALDAPPEEYSLVVIDEAHAFRNPDTDRTKALRKLLRGTPPKDLVLMSATPVNNSLWDLYYLITMFAPNDATFADRGVPSLKGKFHDAMREDPNQLRPDALFDVLDAVAVRRTRHFIKKAYPQERIKLADGTTVEITFPKPKVVPTTYDFDEVLPGFFTDFADALQPPQGPPKLKMARYAPSLYLSSEIQARIAAYDAGHGKPLDGIPASLRVQQVREEALVGLLRSGLLKRLESSAFAFAKTLEKMVVDHGHFLDALKRGIVPSSEALEEWRETDNDEDFDELLSADGRDDFLTRTDSQPAEYYDLPRLQATVEKDRDILLHFLQQARKVKPENDPKLAKLKDLLEDIARQAEKDGRTSEEKRDNRKVIIFSYFADTVEWVQSYLREQLETDRRLTAYRGRLVAVSGDEGSRLGAIFGFAPRTTEAPPNKSADLYDILLTTDILAEGQNLQQARNIINYDLPWNPMRLVQRHGRIDRIGSPHATVFIWCFFPDVQLDAMLLLEQRIRRKLAQAAATIGVEGEVIPQGATGDVVYADADEAEIKRIRSGDATLLENGGEDPNAHSGEEYRRDLQVALQDPTMRRALEALPFAVGSGLKGKEPGYFFCARVGDGKDARPFLRFVRHDQTILRDTLQCLRRITCRPDTPRYLPDARKQGIYEAWKAAQTDVYDEWMKATDPKSLTPETPRILRLIGEHLRNHRPSDVSVEALDRACDAVEAPWGVGQQRPLRAIYEAEGLTDVDKSRRLLDKIRELGLQYKAPEPLEVIQEEDVLLVCWMIVS